MSEAELPPDVPGQFEVRPTGTPATDQYADVTLTILFTPHINQVSSERAAIWQRYTAMLIGNSLISAFASGAATSSYQAVIGALFGISLCVLWYAMTVDGWRVFRMRINRALEFSWTAFDERINPFSITTVYEAGRFGGRLYLLARATIGLFGILHIVIFVLALFNLF